MPITIVLVLVCGLVLHGASLVRIDSQADGRSYVVDLDRDAVRNALQVAGTGASGIPDWLVPYPGAIPLDAVGAGTGSNGSTQYSVRFAIGDNREQTVAYYAHLLRSRGFELSGGGTGLRARNGNAVVYITTFPGSPRFGKPPNVSVTYQPVGAERAQRSALTGAGFDDASGVLHVRDRVTGQMFYLYRAAIQQNDLLPNEQAQKNMTLPAWLKLPEEIWGAGPPTPPGDRKYGDRPTLEVKFSTEMTDDRVCALVGQSLAKAGLQLVRACHPLEAITPDGKARITVYSSRWTEFGSKVDNNSLTGRHYSRDFIKGRLRYELLPGR
jgi:hypothetical protein